MNSCHLVEAQIPARNRGRLSRNGLNAADYDPFVLVGAMQCAFFVHRHQSLQCSKGLPKGKVEISGPELISHPLWFFGNLKTIRCL